MASSTQPLYIKLHNEMMLHIGGTVDPQVPSYWNTFTFVISSDVSQRNVNSCDSFEKLSGILMHQNLIEYGKYEYLSDILSAISLKALSDEVKEYQVKIREAMATEEDRIKDQLKIQDKEETRNVKSKVVESCSNPVTIETSEIYSRSVTMATSETCSSPVTMETSETCSNPVIVKASEPIKLDVQILGAIRQERTSSKWNNVFGLEKAKEILKETVILPVKFPKLFKGKRRPWRCILLFGPSGTGKSLLGNTLAAEASNSSFFSVTSSTFASQLTGESDKLVTALFAEARERKPSIIFMEEIDAIFSAQDGSALEFARRMKTEFLLQMQGVDNDGVLILGTTNKPWLLDLDYIRCFEKRIYIPLPEESARKEMFKFHIGGEIKHNLTTKDLDILGKESEGYTGADIECAVQDAVMQPLRKLQKATHFKQMCPIGEYLKPLLKKGKNADGNKQPIKAEMFWAPCSAEESGAKRLSMENIPEKSLYVPPVTLKDLKESLSQKRPSVNEQDLDNFKKFQRDFGQDI